jgi:hypothetical protein
MGAGVDLLLVLLGPQLVAGIGAGRDRHLPAGSES